MDANDIAAASKKDWSVLMVAVLLFLTSSVVQTAVWVRHNPWDLAFVVIGYANLAALFWCVWRAERLVTLASSSLTASEERRRLRHAVWVLSTVVSCMFAYKVSLVMPANLVVVVWSMTSFVVLVGFYVLVSCKDQGYRALGLLGEDRDGQAFDELVAADELV